MDMRRVLPPKHGGRIGRLAAVIVALIGLCAGASKAQPRMYLAAAGGEIPRPAAADMGQSGGFWQAGLSAEYAARFVLGYGQTWMGRYSGEGHYEALAGAGLGLPLDFVMGHAWLIAEAGWQSLKKPGYAEGGDWKPVRRTQWPMGAGARLEAWNFYASWIHFDRDYPMWRTELGFKLALLPLPGLAK